MAAYYQSHNNTNTTTSTEISDHHHHASNLHTLFLMNPNLTPHHHHAGGYDDHPPPQPPPHNILLPHHFVGVSAGEQNSMTLYGYQQEEARDMSRARHGLSLSLSSQNPAYGWQQQPEMGGGKPGQVSVFGSKYLKAAQELLEEVVHVGDMLMLENNNDDNDQSPKKVKNIGHTVSEKRVKEGGGSGGVQLSTVERHEIQMKKAKLATMLGEAEQRYRQYHKQMQIVIESFEIAAGMGSAKTYGALALKTISKQFRCLKDAILGQIRAANKSLVKDEGGSSAIEDSRLKFIDHQIRQQRALQQLGMIQNHNAWRPQRGLPERSVSVLRAWLFEHFLHPYPKDSDKITLAKLTGLTRSQVSNWFINARVRLWKPMIEDMYEELKEHERNESSGDKTSSKDTSNDDAGASNSIDNQPKTNIVDTQIRATKDQNNGANSSSSFMSMPTSSVTPYKVNNLELPQNQHGFTFTGSIDMEGLSQGSPKRQRINDLLHCENGSTNNGEILIKFGNDKKKQQERDNVYPIISGAMNFIGGGELGSYAMRDIARFEAEDFTPTRILQGNGISLSLGLPPACENHNQQFNHLSATNHSFMSPIQNMHQLRKGNDFGFIGSPSSHPSASGFECIDIQNRKGFAAQLLPDFVA